MFWLIVSSLIVLYLLASLWAARIEKRRRDDAFWKGYMASNKFWRKAFDAFTPADEIAAAREKGYEEGWKARRQLCEEPIPWNFTYAAPIDVTAWSDPVIDVKSYPAAPAPAPAKKRKRPKQPRR